MAQREEFDELEEEYQHGKIAYDAFYAVAMETGLFPGPEIQPVENRNIFMQTAWTAAARAVIDHFTDNMDHCGSDGPGD